MSRNIDLDRYWGVRLNRVQYDCAAMSIIFDLYWTDQGAANSARLLFNGVSKCEFTAEDIFKSEVVELVSLVCEKTPDGLRIVGELSNYEFTIVCAGIDEEPSGSLVS